MALTCPSCDKTNNCDCKNCNLDGNSIDLVIILEDEQCYQCCFCGHKFQEGDSLEHDWNKMIKDFAKKATPDLCLEWISAPTKERKELEERIDVGEFGFEQSFEFHFKMNWKDCDRDTFKKLKRDLTIKQIIND